MTAIEQILSQPWSQRLGWSLVHFLWQGLVVAAALSAAMAALRRRSANLRYAVACMGLVIMVAAPVVTLCLLPTGPPQEGPAASTGQETLDVTMVVGEYAPSLVDPESPGAPALGSVPDAAPTKALAEAVLPAAPLAETPNATHQEPPVTVGWAARVSRFFQPALPWMVAVWVAGVALLAIWHIGGWVGLLRLKQSALPLGQAGLEGQCVAAARRLARKLGLSGPIRLLKSARLVGPVAVGVLRPAVLMPMTMLTGLSMPHIEAILAHEIAHLRRYDYLVNLLQGLVETVLFYHPAVWWVSGRIRIERENCCDDVAVGVCGDHTTYVAALASLAESSAGAPRARLPRLAAAKRLAPGASGGVLARVRRLLGLPGSDATPANRWLAGVLIVASLVIAGAFLCTNTDTTVAATPPAEKEDEATTQPADAAVNSSDIPWGKVVDGLQMRIEPADPFYLPGRQSDLMAVRVYLRNVSEKAFAVYGTRDGRGRGLRHFWDAEVSGEGASRVVRPPGPGPAIASAFKLIRPRQTVVLTTELSTIHPRRKWRIDGRPGDYRIRLIYDTGPYNLAKMDLEKAGFKREQIWTGRVLSNVTKARVWEFPKDAGLPKKKTDALTKLFFKSSLVVLGKITTVHGRDAGTDDLHYQARVSKVLRGTATGDTLRFRSGSGSNRAKYAEGEKVLLFLRGTRTKIDGKVLFAHQWPHVFLAKERKPDAKDGDIYLWPVEPYLKPFAFLAPSSAKDAKPKEPAATKAKIAKLIKQLASDKIKERESAQQKLVEIGLDRPVDGLAIGIAPVNDTLVPGMRIRLRINVWNVSNKPVKLLARVEGLVNNQLSVTCSTQGEKKTYRAVTGGGGLWGLAPHAGRVVTLQPGQGWTGVVSLLSGRDRLRMTRMGKYEFHAKLAVEPEYRSKSWYADGWIGPVESRPAVVSVVADDAAVDRRIAKNLAVLLGERTDREEAVEKFVGPGGDPDSVAVRDLQVIGPRAAPAMEKMLLSPVYRQRHFAIGFFSPELQTPAAVIRLTVIARASEDPASEQYDILAGAVKRGKLTAAELRELRRMALSALVNARRDALDPDLDHDGMKEIRSVLAAATQPAAMKARIAKLIKQLGADKAADRVAAQQELVKIGQPAVDALRTAAKDKDLERAARAKETLAEIEKADTAAPWGEVSGGLQCRLQMLTPAVKPHRPVPPHRPGSTPASAHVLYELRNVSDKPIRLLPLCTPLRLMFTGDFRVLGPDGKKANYVGRSGSPRRPAGPSNFLTIGPGQTLSRRAALVFDFSKPGIYKVSTSKSPDARELKWFYGGDADKMRQNPDRVWMGTLTSNTVIVSVAVPAATQPADAAATRAKIATLIKQLGAEKVAERDKAQKELVKIGLPAVVSLTAATRDKDPERAARAKVALREIESRTWEGPVDGVQVRLRPLKSIWVAGEAPKLTLDLRNRGKKGFPFMPHVARIEVDGVWHDWRGIVGFAGSPPFLEIDKELLGAIKIDPAGPWAPLKKPDKRLKLTPGKHTVRARFTWRMGEPVAGAKFAHYSAISNPVVIEILPAKPAPGDSAPADKTPAPTGASSKGAGTQPANRR